MQALYLRSSIVIVLIASGISSLQSITVAQQKPEQQLIEKQILNEEAQAEYYREQTAKLREPIKVKTFWQNIADNPASTLGVVGALIVAFVTLISFFFNYRATLKNQ